ncbi:Rad52/Rad22 family DNA repair protein [Ramlibacter alkalitolerans]|uniref:Recombinase n=1 Tax=Ramlibacter alkalitolerans TaxID=2039631 RepID=A0ABS1JUD0_9BURK|nr:Rad52/Rad22 family DNA repair protein [Ramlibacter alkalitolerans]MBL0427863.1 hypothetical protein [Ramlibacter alkalitolerans]
MSQGNEGTGPAAGIDWARLREPLSARDLEWRVGSTNADKTKGQALPYLTHSAVADRLDEVVGPGNWECEYRTGPAGGVICRLGLLVGGRWVHKENGADNTEFESVKGGLSGAFKRAAVMWGIGRYLNRFNPPWVEIENKKYLPRNFDGLKYLGDEFLPATERRGNQAKASPSPAASQHKAESAQPARAPVQQPQAAQGTRAASGDQAIPEQFSDAEKELLAQLLDRLKKGTPAHMLRSYVNGDKAKAKLGEEARKYALQRIPA